MKKIFLLFLLLLTVASLFSGCGRKRAPVPPGTLRPERVKDLSYKIVREGAILSWSVPFRNHDGSPLTHIKEFLLFKAEAPIESACLTCPPDYGKPIRIVYDGKPEPGKKMVYEDTTVRKGFYYTYQVKTVKGLLNVSDFSNKVTFAFHSPPASPMNLSAKVFEEGVELNWIPPQEFEDSEPIDDQTLEYKIYRRFSDEEKWTPLPGTTEKTSYFDKIRRTYRQVAYKVAAIFYYHDTKIEGPPSTPVVVKARGLQNIPPPTHVKAARTKRGIRISWHPVRRPGIVGYYVFRRDSSGLVIQLNSEPVPTSSFIDNTQLEPGRYSYWVTSIDDSYPPNQSRASNIVTITVR